MTADLDLLADVIRAAQSSGYVLIGEIPFIRTTEHRRTVTAVPEYERRAIEQLLASRLLTSGGSTWVYYGDHEGPAVPVHVTKVATDMLSRWSTRSVVK